jgi:hypothetical protein
MVRDDKETMEKALLTGREAGLSFEKLDEKMQIGGGKRLETSTLKIYGATNS